ncbi:MAG: glycosyltransferase [Acidobacteriota bacterium]|nr:glycosyltransferase [Acidobacteriota bacterium]
MAVRKGFHVSIWQSLPAGLRRWIYRTYILIRINQPDPTTEWTSEQAFKARPWWIKVLSFIFHSMRVLYAMVTLQGYRYSARKLWPDLPRRDLEAMTLLLLVLRFHSFLLARVWAYAPLIRRLRSPRAVAGSPLRVMHITSSFDIGGTQRQIKNLCTAGSARLEHTTTEIFPEMNFLYRQTVGLERDRYITGGPLRRAIGRCAMTFETRSPQLIQSYKLYRDFVAYRPDVVVGWGHEMCVTAFVAASVARVPHIVFCIRTFNPAYGWVDQEMGRLLGVAHRGMTPHVSAVITNSTPLREDHSRWLGISPDAIQVCPNGIEPLPLTAAEILERRRMVRQQLDIADDVFVMINVGRFSVEKGQMSIVAINQRLMRDYEGRLLWLLCGDGVTLETARAAAADMPNIRFLGRTTAVNDHLCASDAFVMPSDFEGMPNAMMEAMACGLPCISTDRSGAIDVARHGQEALFYPVGDLELMERHVRHLLDDREEARAMGVRARARLSEFSTERCVTRFEEIVESATLGRDETQAAVPAFGGAQSR